MRIPIVVSHGLTTKSSMPWRPEHPIDADRFARYVDIAAEMRFKTLTYNSLHRLWETTESVPRRTLLLDFDHPAASIYDDIFPLLKQAGYVGNLFINTGIMREDAVRPPGSTRLMTWDQIRELSAAGWCVGSHTETHPDLAALSERDRDGTLIGGEYDRANSLIRQQIGVFPTALAYTGDSWSTQAESEALRRYRFARLWIIGPFLRTCHGRRRVGEMLGVKGDDHPDGGPPIEARYLTVNSNPIRIPAMELQALIYDFKDFRAYLQNAIDE